MGWWQQTKRRAVLTLKVQQVTLGLDHLGYEEAVALVDQVLVGASHDDAEMVQVLLLQAADQAATSTPGGCWEDQMFAMALEVDRGGSPRAERLYGLAHYVQARRLAAHFV